MNKSSMAITMALSMLAAGLCIPFVSETVRADRTWTGDTVIGTPQSYSNEVITVKGNLTITNSLSLSGITLVIDTPANGVYHIEVATGATMNILSTSTVRSSNAANHFLFWVRANATFKMDATTLTDCGWEDVNGDWSTYGMYVQSSYAQISNCTIKNNYIGVIVNNGSSPWIYKNAINNNGGTGVTVLGGSAPVIDRNTIMANVLNTNLITSGGITSAGSSPEISNNTISANVDVLTGGNTMGISMSGTGSPKVMFNDITGHPTNPSNEFPWAIFNAGPSAYIYKNNLTGNGNGLFLNTGTSTVIGNLIDNNQIQGDTTAAGYGFVDQGATTVSSDNTITRNRYGIYLSDGSHSTFTGETISQSTVAGIGGDAGTNPFSSNMVNSTLSQNFYDVQFARTLGGTGGGDLGFLNTTYDNTTLNMTDPNARLTVKYQVRVKVTYESTGAVADGAKVKFFDSKGGQQMLVLTKADGWTDLLTMEAVTHSSTANESKSPYNITADKNGKFNYTVVKLNKNMDILLPLDDIAPWVRIDDPSDNYVHNRTTVTLKGFVEPSGRVVAGGLNALVGPDGNWTVNVSLLAEGANIITADGYDRGNNKVTATLTIIRDTTPPSITVTSPTEGLLINKTTVTVKGTTNDKSGATTVNGVTATVAASGDFTAEVPLVEGENTLSVKCRDAVWNMATSVLKVQRDTMAPELTITQPGNGFATNASSVIVRGKSESGAVVMVAGKPASMPGVDFTATITLVEGQNSIVITAQDAAGNINASTITVLRDSTGPALTITSPKDRAVFNGSLIEVRGTTEEGSTVKVNGGGVSIDGTSFMAEVRLALEGPNTIVIEAFDSLKNRVERTMTVYLDTAPPELKITSPLPNAFSGLRTLEVKGKTDANINVSVNDVIVQSGASGLFTVSVPLDLEGSNSIYVLAWDGAWNIAETTFTVTRDTVVNFNITNPKEGFKSKWRNLTVSGDAEAGSMITVQGSTVTVRQDGTWVTELLLNDGANQVSFIVKDKAGNTATYNLNVTKVNAPVNKPGLDAGPLLPLIAIIAVVAVVAVVMMKRKKPPVSAAKTGAGTPPAATPPPSTGAQQPYQQAPPQHYQEQNNNNQPPQEQYVPPELKESAPELEMKP